MTPVHQKRFDALVEGVIEKLPANIKELIDGVPIIAEDRPGSDLVKALVKDGTIESADVAGELCGLYTGIALTERSIEDPDGWGISAGGVNGPETIHLFREAIVDLAGGWEQDGETPAEADHDIADEIRITILHEVGHHFGLDEDELEGLGYA